MSIIGRRNRVKVDNTEFSISPDGVLEVSVSMPKRDIPDTLGFEEVMAAGEINPTRLLERIMGGRKQIGESVKKRRVGVDLGKGRIKVCNAAEAWIVDNWGVNLPAVFTTQRKPPRHMRVKLKPEVLEAQQQLERLVIDKEKIRWNELLPETIPRLIEFVCYNSGKLFEDIDVNDFNIRGEMGRRNLTSFLEYYARRKGIHDSIKTPTENMRAGLVHLRSNEAITSQMNVDRQIVFEQQMELIKKRGRYHWGNVIPETIRECMKLTCIQAGRRVQDLRDTDFHRVIPGLGKSTLGFLKHYAEANSCSTSEAVDRLKNDPDYDLASIQLDPKKVARRQLEIIMGPEGPKYIWGKIFDWPELRQDFIPRFMEEICYRSGKLWDDVTTSDFVINRGGEGEKNLCGFLDVYAGRREPMLESRPDALAAIKADPDVINRMRVHRRRVFRRQMELLRDPAQHHVFEVIIPETVRELFRLVAYHRGKMPLDLNSWEFSEIPGINATTERLVFEMRDDGTKKSKLDSVKREYDIANVKIDEKRLSLRQLELLKQSESYSWEFALPQTITKCVELMCRRTGVYPMDVGRKEFETHIAELNRAMAGFLNHYRRGDNLTRAQAIEELKKDPLYGLVELDERMRQES